MKKSLLQQTADVLFSYWMMTILFVLLGAGAAVATFIENDFGTSTARVLVYNHIWYEIVMLLTTVNLLGVIYRRKMWKQKARFIFHISFVVMLIGAGATRYIGYEGVMHIKEGETQNQMVSLEPYFQITIEKDKKQYYAEFQKEFSAIGSNYFSYDVEFDGKTLNLSLDSYKFAKKGAATMNLIGVKVTIGDEEQVTKLVGQRGSSGIVRDLMFKDNTRVILTYGSKPLSLPFAIKLRDFQLERYPGSMSPSSYASEVTVVDKGERYDYRIFMNHTLKHGGFQFFQSSYDQDEKGTVLSVNKDPGMWPTYLGYFLLTLGLLMNMFDKKSRFAKLIKYTKQFQTAIAVVALTYMFSTFAEANERAMPTNNDIVNYLESFKKDSKVTAKQFGKLVVQSQRGRMKPVDSLNREILNKLYRKSTLMGMDANQVILGMITRPDIWQSVKMLKISTPKLKKELGIEKTRKYIAFNEAFTIDGQYRLKEYINKAYKVDPNKRGTFEKDIIKLDERLNIAYMVYFGNLFNIYPKE